MQYYFRENWIIYYHFINVVSLNDEQLIFQSIISEKKISAAHIKKLQSLFGDTLFRAIELIDEEGSKFVKNCFCPSNLEIWTVEGTIKTHLIYPWLYCDCQNFLVDTIYRKRQFFPCKHILAQKIAEALEKYQIVSFEDKDFSKFSTKIRSWIFLNFNIGYTRQKY